MSVNQKLLSQWMRARIFELQMFDLNKFSAPMWHFLHSRAWLSFPFFIILYPQLPLFSSIVYISSVKVCVFTDATGWKYHRWSKQRQKLNARIFISIINVSLTWRMSSQNTKLPRYESWLYSIRNSDIVLFAIVLVNIVRSALLLTMETKYRYVCTILGLKQPAHLISCPTSVYKRGKHIPRTLSQMMKTFCS